MTNSTNPTDYQPGDIIRYRSWGGGIRECRVEQRVADLGNGSRLADGSPRPGFDAFMVDNGVAVWGYDDEVIEIVATAEDLEFPV